MPTIAMRNLVLRSAAAAVLILGSSVAMAQGAGGGEPHGGGGGGPAGGGEHMAPSGGEHAAPGGGEHAAPSGQMKGSPNANGAAREQAAPGGEKAAPAAQGAKGEIGHSEQMKGSPNANGMAQPGPKGEAGGHAALSGEKRTKFVGALRQGHAEALHHPSDFRIGRGAIIPDHYHFYPLPPELIEIVPEYRGYDYIIVDDEIIILEPGTRRIVDIIEE